MQKTEQNELIRFLLKAFEEDNGNPSSMRVLSFICLIVAISFGTVGLLNPVTEAIALNLTITFLTAAFAPKTIQKFAEKPDTQQQSSPEKNPH